MADKGLKGRTLITLPPDAADAAQQFAIACGDWQNFQHSACTKCSRQWGHPRDAIGDLCKMCCEHPAEAALRGYMRKANGELCPQQLCIRCGHRANIRQNDLAPILDLCLRDNTTRYAGHPCAKCGSTTGTELHHWAPQAIFNDADSWPVSWLCPDCHRLWHKAMREAGGRALPYGQRYGETPA